jgi:hypothetical protein
VLAPGVVEIPAQLACQVCWRQLAYGMEDTMAKITRHGGPSNKADGTPAPQPLVLVGEQGPEQFPGDLVPIVGPGPFEVIGPLETVELPPPPDEGGEQPSPGNNSETFTETPPTKTATSKAAPRRHARGAANRL